jgi:leucyl aminopeptidase
MHTSFVSPDAAKAPASLHLFTKESWNAASEDLFENMRAIAKSQAFTGASGALLKVPGKDGALAHVLFGLGNGKDALAVAGLSGALPEGDYELVTDAGSNFDHMAAAWADGAYRFDRYLTSKAKPPRLIVPETAQPDKLSREAAAIDRLRDNVNTPPHDFGPNVLAGVVSDMAERFGAKLEMVIGDALLEQNFPLVHAVGRANSIEPRLCELTWGDDSHPHVAVVGKGVTFDTGGLNIKVGAGMRIMKKDMGGAAHAIALAELIMGANLPVFLKLYIPAVENSIDGNAFRPGDVLPSRKGLTVEIDNTDAEGRLILADALTKASEADPDLLIDFATLTGAARVAVGPDLAPFYTDDEQLAQDISAGALTSGDPAWRMPLWDPYLKDLKSPIADLVNSGGRMGGSITAALFLKQFVDAKSWVHLDVWAWRLGKYGRPEGGAACGLRAMFAMVEGRYGAD